VPAIRSLVTGGSGFIGRHVVAALASQGHYVRILDLEPPREKLQGIEYVAGSILDAACVRDALRGIDHVYHVAGISQLWTRDPADFRRINYEGTQAMLDAAREAGVGRFVHCSSETVTLADFGPMPGPYSRSKLQAEQAVRAAAENGLPAVVVAPTVTIGPNDDNQTPGTAMLSVFLGGRVRFYLDCTLNLVDVRDVARGMFLAGAHGRMGERYFLGGHNISVAALLRSMQEFTQRRQLRIPIPGALALMVAALAETVATHLTHRPPIASVEGVRLGRLLRPIASDLAQRDLGYAARPLEVTLRDAIAWLCRTARP